jgi:hypothetical protein
VYGCEVPFARLGCVPYTTTVTLFLRAWSVPSYQRDILDDNSTLSKCGSEPQNRKEHQEQASHHIFHSANLLSAESREKRELNFSDYRVGKITFDNRQFAFITARRNDDFLHPGHELTSMHSPTVKAILTGRTRGFASCIFQ